MKFLKRPVFTGFMPNLLGKEVLLALSFMFPWNWKKLKQGKAVSSLENKLQTLLEVQYAISFDSGRSSLQIALQALGIEKSDEVLLQAYTCCVVSNAIIWAGGTPVYVDIADDFNMDPQDLEKKITSKSKVLVIQHTFAVPANLDALLAVAKKYNLKVIEDSAHVIGGTYKNKMLGTFGDIAMLSFGTDKSISCGRGGALLTNDRTLAEGLRLTQEKLSTPSNTKILQQLFTFILFFISKPLYTIVIGKVLLAMAKKLHITSRIIEQREKRGEPVQNYPAKLPNALALIALHQLEHLAEFNQKRREISKIYQEKIQNSCIQLPLEIKNIPFLRFPIRVKNPAKIHSLSQKEGILLGDWYNTVIAPKDADEQKMCYVRASCPNAEKLAAESVNLPTHIHISSRDQEKILKILNNYVE